MHTKVQGRSAHPRLTGDLHTVNFGSLLHQFKEDIRGFASSYGKYWKDDLFQEGSIALYEASQKFILLPASRDFRPYALKAIKRRMIDFYRKNIDGIPEPYNPTITNEDFDQEEYIYNLTADLEFFTTTTFDTDYQIVFAPELLASAGFTKTEMKVFDLLWVRDYTVTQIAAELRLSVGRTSKIVAGTKSKCQARIKYMSQQSLQQH